LSETAFQNPALQVNSDARRGGLQFWAVALVGAVSFAAVGHLLIKYGLFKLRILPLVTPWDRSSLSI